MKNMGKRMLAGTLTGAMALALLTGCSGSDTGNTASDKAQKDQDSPQTLRDNMPEVLVPHVL